MLSHEFEDFPLPCWIPTGSKMYVMSTPDQETLAAENFARTMHFQVSKIVQTEAHQTQNLLLIWTWLKLPKLFISIMIDNDPKKKGRIQISRLNPAISRNWIWPPCLWHNGINHSKTKKHWKHLKSQWFWVVDMTEQCSSSPSPPGEQTVFHPARFILVPAWSSKPARVRWERGDAFPGVAGGGCSNICSSSQWWDHS